MKRRPRPRRNLLARALVGAALALCQVAPVFSQTGRRLIAYADPFVGTENGGNIVPGAQIPFGFVHVSPDTEPEYRRLQSLRKHSRLQPDTR